MQQAQFAHLCTVMSNMHHRRAGYPFGTLVDFAADEAGYPIFCLSPLAIHTRNIMEDPRCSLVVQMPGWTGVHALPRICARRCQPHHGNMVCEHALVPKRLRGRGCAWRAGLANARVTIFGDVYQLPSDLQEAAREIFLQKQVQTPVAPQFFSRHTCLAMTYRTPVQSYSCCRKLLYAAWGDVVKEGPTFVQVSEKKNRWVSGNYMFFRMHRISDIYFVGGFGTVQWVDVGEYTAAKPDEIVADDPHHTLQVRHIASAAPLTAALPASQGEVPCMTGRPAVHDLVRITFLPLSERDHGALLRSPAKNTMQLFVR